ncbi:MAG TPA: arylsulfotransferase family protein [Solirubrobacteraceae bacterium]|nr:arylsulfotransferase family protein [Solirubrobacteraceae bacterium]
MAVTDRTRRGGLTRRQLLQGAGGAAVLAAAGGGIAQLSGATKPLPEISSYAVRADGSSRAFHSRPDLHPPTVTATPAAAAERWGAADRGFLFLGPGPVSLSGSDQYGPLIVDRNGAPIWFSPVAAGLQVTNFAAARYRGEPVLVWWEGKILQSGYGHGEAVVLDRSYREVARVRAAGGRWMDLHALTLTPQGTALFTCYPETVPMDLSSINGPRDSQVIESIIQEVDIATGRLLFEWRSLEHIPVAVSQEPMSEPYDYLHVNSIQQLSDGSLLVSGRHTWAIYKLERGTGNVIWTLGGNRSDFEMGPGAQFAWQHDASQFSKRLLTVFDNGTNGPIKSEQQARGLVLEVDERHRKVTVRHAYTTTQRFLPGAMGSVQILPSGRVVVGWGVASYTSEFAADGELLFEDALPAGMYSYRGMRFPWRGTPHHQPAVAGGRDRNGGPSIVYASWNGATNFSGWQVAAGTKHDQVHPLGVARRRGFETAIPLHPKFRFASVTAVDRLGRRLRHSPIVRL